MSEIIYPKSSDEVFYRKNNSISLCHGSKEVVEKPRFGKGEVNNDYGRGFYTVSVYDEELAKEWACSPFNKTGVGYVNQYDLDTSDLEVLDFDKMDIIYWIVLTATCREPNIDADDLKLLQSRYLIDTSRYDCIYGWRCDDTYSQIITRFMDDGCSDEAIREAIHLGHLNRQFVLMSEKAFDHISFVGSKKIEDFTQYRSRFDRRKIEADNGFAACVRNNRTKGRYLYDYLVELK